MIIEEKHKLLFAKAEQYYSKNQLEESSKIYESLFTHYHKDISLIINLSHNLILQEKFDDAKKYIELYLESNSCENDMLIVNYSSVLIEENTIDIAIELLFKETHRKSKNTLIYNNLGWCYYLLEDYQSAVKYLDKSIEISKYLKENNPLAFCNRGIIKYYKLKNKEGIVDLQIARIFDDKDAKTALNAIENGKEIKNKEWLTKYKLI